MCVHVGPEAILRELVFVWGRSQEPNSGPWVWQQVPLATPLSHWLLVDLELPPTPKCGDALDGVSTVLVDTGLLTRVLSA